MRGLLLALDEAIFRLFCSRNTPIYLTKFCREHTLRALLTVVRRPSELRWGKKTPLGLALSSGRAKTNGRVGLPPSPAPPSAGVKWQRGGTGGTALGAARGRSPFGFVLFLSSSCLEASSGRGVESGCCSGEWPFGPAWLSWERSEWAVAKARARVPNPRVFFWSVVGFFYELGRPRANVAGGGGAGLPQKRLRRVPFCGEGSFARARHTAAIPALFTRGLAVRG